MAAINPVALRLVLQAVARQLDHLLPDTLRERGERAAHKREVWPRLRSRYRCQSALGKWCARRDSNPRPPPPLSDDAVVQIHDFIHHVLDRFEARYGDQIHRFYADLCRDSLIHSDSGLNLDDPPF